MLRKLGAITFVLATVVGAIGCTRPSEARADNAAPAPATAGPEKKAAGSRAEGQGYVVEVQPPASSAVGAVATAKVVLKPTGGYKVNKEFPTALTVAIPAGVELAKPKQVPADAAKFAEDGAVFDVAFTAKEAGDKHFEATFKFAVCTADTCDPKSEKLAWTVAVK